MSMNRILPFGPYKGQTIDAVPENYLHQLAKSDCSEYWKDLAKQVLSDINNEHKLDSMADDFLKRNGIDPRRLT